MPATATLAVAENHIKPNCIAKQNVVMRRRKCHKRDPATISLYNRNTTMSRYISNSKKRGQKNQKNDGQMCLPCLDKPVLVQNGGLHGCMSVCRVAGWLAMSEVYR